MKKIILSGLVAFGLLSTSVFAETKTNVEVKEDKRADKTIGSPEDCQKPGYKPFYCDNADEEEKDAKDDKGSDKPLGEK